MKKLLYIFILLTLSLNTIHAQVKDTAGIVFVSNDYREATSDAIIVKWVANKVYYQKGFDVYRQESGQTTWLKLTKSPLMVKEKVPTYLSAKDPDTQKLLDYTNDLKYEEFQENLVRVFVAIKSVQSPYFAEALGVVYYDESAVKGTAYKYKVVGNSLTGTETIHISAQITSGDYKATFAPQDVVFKRTKKKIDFNWKVENERYYGVYIYRKSSLEKEYKLITPQVLAINKAENQKGELTYPKIFYEDKTVNNEESYTYKFVGLDYFGQETEYSQELTFPSQDFDPPAAPYDVKADARLLGVELKWSVEQASDLKGLNVYRHLHPDDEKIKQNSALLSPLDTVFYQEVAKSGGYYYAVGAVDSAGNEALSLDIFIDVHDLIPPAIPQNVRVEVDTGKVTLKWDAVTDEDLMGYFIHRSLNDDNNEDNEFIIVNKYPVVGTQYVEEIPVKVKNKFVYKIVSVDSSYNRSKHSSLSVVQLPDVTPPQSPFLKNIHTDHSKIKLSWLPYHESDLAGYHVYRSVEEDSSKYAKVNKELIDAQAISYEDVNEPGQVYYYYVVAVDQSGNVSKPSGVFKGMSDASEGGTENAHHDELAVRSLKVKLIKKKSKAKITWENPDVESFIGLVVYKGTSENKLRPISGNIKDISFVDSKLKKGTTVYYQVRTFDDHGHKSLSKILKVTVK